jgi:alkaline phosphatase
MTVHTDRMRENLEITSGALFSQRVLLALVESGMQRDDAYRIVQRLAQQAWDTQTPLRELLAAEPAAAGLDLEALAREKQRPLLASVAEVAPDARRAMVLYEAGQFELAQAMEVATRVLSRNPKGYFLMVEWDTHTDNLRRGLDRMVELDRVIEQAANGRKDTLLLFTADHSFDIRIRGGEPGKPLLEGFEEAEAKRIEEKRRDLRIPAVRMDNGHTGEEVLVAAQGPGAERVHGYMSNTDLFKVMMAAFGWK